MQEEEHVIKVLDSARDALHKEDAQRLKELSDQTIHCASCFQDAGSTAIPVLIYALGKVVERKERLHVKNWDKFVGRIDSSLALAKKAAQDGNEDAYENYLQQARKAFEIISIGIKPFIEEIIRKASINKAGKIYEHGISTGRTAKMLGVTQWELSEYTGHTKNLEAVYSMTGDVRVRAKMALEFFS